MNDVSVAAERRLVDLMMSRSPEERVAMACRMFATAKALIIAGLRSEGVDDHQLIRRRLFIALHGADFDPQQQARIIAHLESRSRV